MRKSRCVIAGSVCGSPVDGRSSVTISPPTTVQDYVIIGINGVFRILRRLREWGCQTQESRRRVQRSWPKRRATRRLRLREGGAVGRRSGSASTVASGWGGSGRYHIRGWSVKEHLFLFVFGEAS